MGCVLNFSQQCTEIKYLYTVIDCVVAIVQFKTSYLTEMSCLS